MSISVDQLELDLLQERMKGVRKLLEDSKWSEAATEMSDIRDRAIIVFNDELALGMAEYYYLLGNVLVCKIENTQDLFGQQVRDAEGEHFQQKQEDDQTDSEEEELNQALKQNEEVDLVKIQTKPTQEDIQEEPKQDLEDKQNPKEEVDGEIQLAWENLEIAKVILDKEHERLQQNQFSDQLEKEKIIRHLARVHLRKAELEQWRDNFVVALEEHQKALELRLSVDNHEKSRDIAESYFLTGNVLMYHYANGCENAAMTCYKKALQILENNLSDEIGLPRKDVSKIEEQALVTIHLNASFLDSDKTVELKSIIKMLYDKIDDLKLALKESQSEEYKNLQTEYKEQKNAQSQIFNQPLIQNQGVVNLGLFGNAAKRKLEQDNLVKEKEQQKENEKENENENGKETLQSNGLDVQPAEESLEKGPITKLQRD